MIKSIISLSILYIVTSNIRIKAKELYPLTVIIINWAWQVATLGGNSIKGRPKKNQELLIGRAGRNAIESEDIARESLRWQRRKQTIEKFRGN